MAELLAEANRIEIIRLIDYINTLHAHTIKHIQMLLEDHETKLELLEPLLDTKEPTGERVRFALDISDEESITSEAIQYDDSNM